MSSESITLFECVLNKVLNKISHFRSYYSEISTFNSTHSQEMLLPEDCN